MMDCKKVLTETDGDMEKAIELLRERGIAKAAKNQEELQQKVQQNVMFQKMEKLELQQKLMQKQTSQEKPRIQRFRYGCSKTSCRKNPTTVEELLEQESITESGKTVQEVLTNKIATIGENMNIRRFERFETTGLIEKYIHGDGKIAVLVELINGNAELAKDICMQIAAARPEFVKDSDVPEERVQKEMEILKVQAMNEGKPEAIAEKMVQGRLKKFYAEICLVDQDFVKNPDKKLQIY